MTSSQSVDQFLLQLKRRQLAGSNQTATETANLLRTVISNARWSNAKILLQTLKDITRQLIAAQPVEFSVGNVGRCILRLIREEYKGIYHSSTAHNHANSSYNNNGNASASNLSVTSGNSSADDLRLSLSAQQMSDSSMYNLLANAEQPEVDYSKQLFSLKQSIIQSVNELIDELETVESAIAAQAGDFIDNGDTLLTVGRSHTVEQFFLQAAAKKRHFSVIVAESAVPETGRVLCRTLQEASIPCTLIPDSSIFAVMSRVNRVVIGCHAVTANGGLIARSGTLLAAIAARHFSAPVCVVTGMYKVTPIYPENHHQDFNLYTSPHSIVPFADGLACQPNVKVVNPLFDHVDPAFVDLIITNVGTHAPTYVYRLLGELYDPEDLKQPLL